MATAQPRPIDGQTAWICEAMMTEADAALIELRVDRVAQLFQSLDPFPFREKDLDKEAEEFIVGWARELAPTRKVRITVHFPDTETESRAAQELPDAFRRYFSERADAIQRDLKELLRIGRRSLGIGLCVLVACLLSSHIAGGLLTESPLRRLVEESFLILGWVANWRPLEIFLYDWWPFARRRDLYLRLSRAIVESKPYAEHATRPGRIAELR